MKRSLSVILSVAIGITPAFAQQSAAHPQDTEEQNSVSGVPAQKFVLEDGTPIKLVLSQTVSSSDSSVGQTVSFEVVEDVLVDGVVVVTKGSTAWATVTTAEHKKTLGRGGKLDMNIDKVRLADGSKTLLAATKSAKGGGHTGAMTGAIVATSLILWPAAPFFLFIHGKDITIPKGTPLTAFVQGDDVLDRTRFVRPTAVAEQTSAPPAQPVAPSNFQRQSTPAPTQPVMQVQSPDQQPSLGEVARQNRARKAQQDEVQAQSQTPPQN